MNSLINNELNKMIEICDNYAQHCVQKIFLYICFENMVQVDFFYEFNKTILEPHKLNDSNCEFKFDVSEKTQEVVGKALFDKAKKIIDIYKNEKEQPPVEIKAVYDNKNTEISISDTAKFKSYMRPSGFSVKYKINGYQQNPVIIENK